MNFSYRPTLADYRAALRLHYRHKLSRRILHIAGLWLLPFVMLAFLVPSIYQLAADRENYSGGIGWGLLGLGFASFIPLSRYVAVRKQFKAIFPAQSSGEVLLDIDEERIISTIPGSSEGKFFWTAILNFAQDEKVILLYIRKNMFLFIPTAALSSPEAAELTDRISSKLVRK